MLKCPRCGNEVKQDPKSEDKVLCYSCKKRYEKQKVQAFWQRIESKKKAEVAQAAAEAEARKQAELQRQAAEQQAAKSVPVERQEGARTANVPTQQPQEDAVMSPRSSVTRNGFQEYQDKEEGNRKNPLALASLIVAIVALLLCWIPFVNVVSIVMAVVACVLGAKALGRANDLYGAGRGKGRASVVIAVVSIVLALIANVGAIALTNYIVSKGEVQSDNLIEIISGADMDDIQGLIAQQTGDAPWSNLDFYFNSEECRLGKSTLKGLGEQGWILDLKEQGYPDGYEVQPNEEISVIQLENKDYPDDLLYVNVANDTDSPVDIMDATISKISFNNKSNKVDFHVGGGGTYGMTFDEIRQIYGEPADEYANSENGYESITYKLNGDRDTLTFEAQEGAVYEIEMTSL